MTQRVARGSLNGRWPHRTDRRPNLQGELTIEKALPAGTTLHLSGWTNTAGAVEFLSLSATVATKAAPWREPRAESQGWGARRLLRQPQTSQTEIGLQLPRTPIIGA
ncbi:MAG: hypothetical protein NTV56_00645 [Alphaproteobacteria bacterium]|nr:hypothetical protein [Alphaproteobacteria bacterium]